MPAKKRTTKTKSVTEKAKALTSNSFTDKLRSLGKIKLGILIVILLIAAYYLRGLIIVATVNGEPISRLSVIRVLEKQQGAQALDTIITEKLILQEARKQNLNVTQTEIDEEIAKIEANLSEQGQNLDQLLQFQGISKEELNKQIKLQKLVSLMINTTEITDEEVDQYLEENESTIPEGIGEEEIKEQARESLKQQKLSQDVQLYLEELRSQANINYILNY